MANLTDIKIDSNVALELKRFCLDKHGTTYGAMKRETENAIRTHIRED